MGAPTPARPSLAELADVRTGDVITTVDGKDMPAFTAATRSLSGPVDFTMEWDGEEQTIAVEHSVLSAVPASFEFTGDMFAMTAGWMPQRRGWRRLSRCGMSSRSGEGELSPRKRRRSGHTLGHIGR
ncbi:hypothetical protein [Rhodococcus opacus]|uniref:hypothetical protein n=1 Tax=Rhodococcus opacus TaxID=37919 RepID=UPI001CEC8894|nr:hypothetical protein [Rhodococcus opacus]